jgi:hypothetical protein
LPLGVVGPRPLQPSQDAWTGVFRSGIGLILLGKMTGAPQRPSRDSF